MTSTDTMDLEGRHKHRQTVAGRVICLQNICVRPRMLHAMTPGERAALRSLPHLRAVASSRARFDVNEAIRVLTDYATVLRRESSEWRRAREQIATVRRAIKSRTFERWPVRRSMSAVYPPTKLDWERLFAALPAMAEKPRLMRMERRAAAR